jgi:CubicO group peptidase (beta-lactamase class C family)
LDAPIVEVLPYFQLEDERYKQITMQHLLTQTAGLPLTPETKPSEDWVGKIPQTDDGALERFVRGLRDTTLHSDPGDESGSGFSNMSFDIAGDVIAKASNSLFEPYIQEHILNPLGMAQSTLFPLEANHDVMAKPHVVDKGEIIVSDLITFSRERTPSVGLLTSIEDLNRWAITNLNRGELDGKRILQSSTYDQIWKPILERGYAEDFANEGLAWVLGTNRGRPVCHYWGNDVGFHSAIYLEPEQKCGIVVLGNQFTAADYNNWGKWYGYTVAGILINLIASD